LKYLAMAVTRAVEELHRHECVEEIADTA